MAMLPVLRKRLADALGTEVWLLGEGTDMRFPVAEEFVRSSSRPSLARGPDFADGEAALLASIEEGRS